MESLLVSKIQVTLHYHKILYLTPPIPDLKFTPSLYIYETYKNKATEVPATRILLVLLITHPYTSTCNTYWIHSVAFPLLFMFSTNTCVCVCVCVCVREREYASIQLTRDSFQYSHFVRHDWCACIIRASLTHPDQLCVLIQQLYKVKQQ